MDDARFLRSAARTSPAPVLDDRALVTRFESLGGSGHGCEFGLFQRHYDAEPLGLLRWADLAPDLLIRALETRFEGVGLAENTTVFKPDGSDEWWSRDTRFWMAMRSFVKVADVGLEKMSVALYRRLQFLRRKLIEDLEAGEKIFVYKNLKRNLTEDELRRLHAAVRSYGDSTLFYLRYADEAHPSGTVIAGAPGLLVGFIDHFAFSPDDKSLGAANEVLLGLCRRADALHAGAVSAEPAPPAAFTILPAQRRRVVLIGNCQALAMMGLYRKFVAGGTGEILTHVPSYTDLTQADRTVIEQADLIVEQLFDLNQQAQTAAVASGTPRIHMPMVTAGFLWPYAGQAHPGNKPYPFLYGGPYGGEASDTYLNRLILAGTDPEEAVEAYLALDIPARTNLDRMYELIMDRQRSRDEAADYRIADIIEQHFRAEPVFLSPYHPNTRVAVALATQLFEKLGAPRRDIERMQDGTRRTPFPKDELPLHPSVCKHFGLDFVSPERRYRFLNEGFYTIREYALRYMRFEWNDALEEGMSLVQAGKPNAGQDRLVAGLARNPESAAGHNALSHVLSHQNKLEEATVECRRAIAIEPDMAPYHAHLGNLLRQLGQLDAAEAELLNAIAADPTEPHHHVLLAHLLRQRGQYGESCRLVRQALKLDPYAAPLHEVLANFLEAPDDLADALAALQQAAGLAPEDPKYLLRLTQMLDRLGRTEEAVEAAQAIVALDPQSARWRIVLSDILRRQGKNLEALNAALMAAVLDPDSAEAYCHLGDLLGQGGDAAAETALRRAARLNPKNAQVRYRLSDYLRAQDRLDEAIATAREATELDPGNFHRLVYLAQLLVNAKDLVGAEAVQRQAVEVDPNNIGARVLLSDLMARQERRQEALVEAEIAVLQQPDNAQALGHLAHVTQMLGNLDKSEELFRRAIEIAPANAHLRNQLSRVQSRKASTESR